MARLDEYIFGYSRGRVAPEDIPTLTNVLLRLGICSEVSGAGEFTIRRRDRERFVSYATTKLCFELSDTLGIYGFLMRRRKRYGVIAGLILSAVLLFLSSGLVWDVRISGNETISDYELENMLSDRGLFVGASWRDLDKNALEAELLSQNPDVAWISVNRRGTVAHVEIIESENVGYIEEVAPLYSNIVAECDGVIDEITVKSGSATVKVGDVVKAGDILISGIVESESGVVLCRAEGTVRATNAKDVTAEIPATRTERVPLRQKIAKIRIILFNFSINIFKNYGNSENDCDIIEEIREFALFDKYRLPISLGVSYRYEYTETSKELSKDEMIAYAKRELDGRILTMFKDADVIKLRTDGEFTDGVYRLTTRVVYSTDIGRESAIEIS